MDYQIDVFDTWGRRVGVFFDVPVLEATSALVGNTIRIRGILPKSDTRIGHGYTIEVRVEGLLFVRATVVSVNPIHSDTRRLILERYVYFHEFVSFEAEWRHEAANRRVLIAHVGELVSDAVKRAINRTPGPIHYGVAHSGHPAGAIREYNKFIARKNADNELEVGGISSGQWVDSSRIDLTDAYAKDGDTIAGLRVDGVDWPDLRMMMIDTEETSINPHTIALHPEVAEWTSTQYNQSHYKRKADAATDTLQSMIDGRGIDYIELNPHRGPDGNFDDRIDAYGRYLGLVYADGRCLNAELVELDLADVLLYDDGRGHVPEMELKDFFSYAKKQVDTVETTAVSVAQADANINIFEWLTTLGYLAHGFGWSMDQDYCVTFRALDAIDYVVFEDLVAMSVEWETSSDDLANSIEFAGNTSTDGHTGSYAHDESVRRLGERYEHLSIHAITHEDDADAVVEALLDDIAFPEPTGRILVHHGDTNVRPGQILELRRAPLRRVTEAVAGEWGDRFVDRLVARVRSVTHTIEGRHIRTNIELTSPLRTLDRPLTALERGQAGDSSQFQFRLDDGGVGLDIVYHLD